MVKCAVKFSGIRRLNLDNGREKKREKGGVKENRLKKWKGLKRKRKDLERTNFKKWPPDPG